MPDPTLSVSSPGGQALPAGTRLEEFVIERVLGSGGFGITYLAKDSRLGRQVVIKENLPAQFCWRDTTSLTVQPRSSEGEDADNFRYSLESFEKEAATLASLDHPGIVKVLRSFEANGTAYFVMPFVEGVTFDEVLREREAQHRPFTEAELVALLDKVLAALGYLHERGIYHRDIKPGNLLITASGDPVLIDFGAARQRLSERSLTVIESPGYTPFEQMQSRGKVGAWSDLYALGGTVYKAITGETPAKAADRIIEDELMPLAQRTELGSRYSQRFLGSIDRAMRSKLSERPQSAEEWVKSLQSQVDGPSPKPRAEAVPPLSPKGVDLKGPSNVNVNHDWDAHTSAPKAAEAVQTKSQKSISKLDLVWLWGGVVVIALMLVGLVSLLRTNSASNTYTSESSKSLDTPLPAAVVPAPAEPSVSDESNDPITLDSAVAGQSIQFEIGQGQKMTLQFCPPGSFLMGSPASEANWSYDEDQVQVTISKGFWLWQTEVTQAQWRAVMGNNPSHFKGDDLPVEQVSWEDAQAFIAKLNQNVPLPPGWIYALPTEAQWEYACRAGTETPFHFGSVLNGREANCDGNNPYGTTIAGPYLKETVVVGTYAPNEWGLHDMHGNVWEWCADGYVEKLLGGFDPVAPSAGSGRVIRGGSWNCEALLCRAANRDWGTPDYGYYRVGFRLAAVPARATSSKTAVNAYPVSAASKDLPFIV
jgi:formylglycine-generating enzyme required for sulfatase activity/predicted Ser/Thr protein kinase